MVRRAGCLGRPHDPTFQRRAGRRSSADGDHNARGPLQGGRQADRPPVSPTRSSASGATGTCWPERLPRGLSTGGVIHLWGHSWEIEQNNDWGRLTCTSAMNCRASATSPCSPMPNWASRCERSNDHITEREPATLTQEMAPRSGRSGEEENSGDRLVPCGDRSLCSWRPTSKWSPREREVRRDRRLPSGSSLPSPRLPPYTTSMWDGTSGVERFAYSVAGCVDAPARRRLAINTVLPWVGVPRPLAAIPILILVDVINSRSLRPTKPATGHSELAVGMAGVAGTGDSAHGGRRVLCSSGRVRGEPVEQRRPVTRCRWWPGRNVRGLDLAPRVGRPDRIGDYGRRHLPRVRRLLFMTSCGLVGDRARHSARVPGVPADGAHGQWNFDFKNAFNACLSITILPTEIAPR